MDPVTVFFSEEQNFQVKGEICLDFRCWNILRFSLNQSLSLTSFYQFVKVSFKGVESGTVTLNLCMICLQTLSTKILSTKFCT
ncbi:hypothetical protein Bca4012_032521 [Brassica carinata]|nr:unnamed protein product [Brassica napus]CDY70959.1 BnaCnng70520D [Brassica napus]VDD11712.1 unnamed protein product [Brassica oleracea]